MRNLYFIILLIPFTYLKAQVLTNQHYFSRSDTLRGSLRFERTCFDVLHYTLDIKINPDQKNIIGYNQITFKVIENTKKIQLDLFENMQVDSILYKNQKLEYKREYNAVFIYFNQFLKKNNVEKITFYYSGHPIIAKKAPWDGGFVFNKDSFGKHWIGVAVQGIGASLWYPVKDHQSDKPDNGASIKVAVPNGLMNVSNGRFLGNKDLNNGYTRWDWEVKEPINSYNITLNIGDYIHFGEHYKDLDLDYYVLRENIEKAKKHFEEVKPMMDCFQEKFGKYPFIKDGYKMVETPYLGMEHQSAIAYGNKYKKGYNGTDLSGTGIGLLFDFIIIHESGHEWFGNSITAGDIADMWIHEAFTTYTETVFIECHFGYDKALQYINGQKHNIKNDNPMIGIYGVNQEGSSDMYYKGALLLNTIRHIINDDKKWWALLLDYSNEFKYKTIDTKTVVQFFNKKSNINLTSVFEQYLKYKDIPTLEFRIKDNKIEYRWKTDISNFKMPATFTYNNKIIRIIGTNNWQHKNIKDLISLNTIKIDQNKFYINVEFN